MNRRARVHFGVAAILAASAVRCGGSPDVASNTTSAADAKKPFGGIFLIQTLDSKTHFAKDNEDELAALEKIAKDQGGKVTAVLHASPREWDCTGGGSALRQCMHDRFLSELEKQCDDVVKKNQQKEPLPTDFVISGLSNGLTFFGEDGVELSVDDLSSGPVAGACRPAWKEVRESVFLGSYAGIHALTWMGAIQPADDVYQHVFGFDRVAPGPTSNILNGLFGVFYGGKSGRSPEEDLGLLKAQAVRMKLNWAIAERSGSSRDNGSNEWLRDTRSQTFFSKEEEKKTLITSALATHAEYAKFLQPWSVDSAEAEKYKDCPPNPASGACRDYYTNLQLIVANGLYDTFSSNILSNASLAGAPSPVGALRTALLLTYFSAVRLNFFTEYADRMNELQSVIAKVEPVLRTGLLPNDKFYNADEAKTLSRLELQKYVVAVSAFIQKARTAQGEDTVDWMKQSDFVTAMKSSLIDLSGSDATSKSLLPLSWIVQTQ